MYRSIQNILALLLICCSYSHVWSNPNDPEVMYELWKQLYRFLPPPSLGPHLAADLSISVDLSVSVDNVEVYKSGDGLVCRTSMTVLSEWPVTDPRVADSRLIELVNGGVRLDHERVWHPELVVIGSHRFERLAQRLELRTASPSTDQSQLSGSTRRSAGLVNMDPDAGFRHPEKQTDGTILGNQYRETSNGLMEIPHYALIESYSVEVACSKPRKFSHVAAVLCPIWIRQEGSLRTQPIIKWTERESCLLTDSVKQATSHVTLTKLFGNHIDKQGSDHNLAINICFAQSAHVLHGATIGFILVSTALLLIWINPLGSRDSIRPQLILLAMISTLWLWLSSSHPHQDGFSGPVDLWCLLCLIFVLSTNCITILYERWVHRKIWSQLRHTRLRRNTSMSLIPNKSSAMVTGPGGIGVPNLGQTGHTNAGNNNNNPMNGCFQAGCNCNGSSSGTCVDSSCTNCPNLLMTSRQTNNAGIYCANNSCGAGTNLCGVLTNGNTTNHSPAPIGFSPSSMGIAPAKMDNYNDTFMCSNNSDSGNGGTNGSLQGIQWRQTPHHHMGGSTRHGNGPGIGVIGFDMTECQMCSCPYVGAMPQLNATNSPAPPYNSICNSLSSNKTISNCLSTGVKITITIAYFVVTAIFWISLLAQGTVPEACLGASVCQRTSKIYLK